MPTSRADAIRDEVMASVLALKAVGRDADLECGAALDALWDKLRDYDDDDGDDGDDDDDDDDDGADDLAPAPIAGMFA